MKRLPLLLFFATSLTPAQSSFFCIGGVTFTTSELARRAGLTTTIKITFDIQDYKVRNLVLADSTSHSVRMLAAETIENIGRVIFLRDTIHASLYLTYSHVSARLANTDYAIAVSDSQIQLVFRRPEGSYPQQEGIFRPVPQTGDTITWSTIVIGEPTNSAPANILVERIFSNGQDSSIIRENNHPELTIQILDAAAGFGLDFFLWLQNPSIPISEISPKVVPEAPKKRYFLKFKILRRIPPCGFQEEL